jgi:hypothetical protein
MPINDSIKRLVRQHADCLCEYCHSSERLSANRFTIEHLIPRSIGGSDGLDNLALACRRCNERRYNFMDGLDPETQEVVPLFNPRQQDWADHFIWIGEGMIVGGITPIGRATCNRLDLNDMRYPETDSIRATRRLWLQTGLHPPLSDLPLEL